MSDKIHEIIAAYLAGECVLEEERQEVKRWLREHAGEKDIELLQGMFRSSRLMREKAVCRKVCSRTDGKGGAASAENAEN